MVRTSGETRLSDFLLLQSRWAALHFTPALWPDFSFHDMLAALLQFQREGPAIARMRAAAQAATAASCAAPGLAAAEDAAPLPPGDCHLASSAGSSAWPAWEGADAVEGALLVHSSPRQSAQPRQSPCQSAQPQRGAAAGGGPRGSPHPLRHRGPAAAAGDLRCRQAEAAPVNGQDTAPAPPLEDGSPPTGAQASEGLQPLLWQQGEVLCGAARTNGCADLLASSRHHCGLDAVEG